MNVTPAQVKIKVNANGTQGVVVIDGVNFTEHVGAFILKSEAGETTQLILVLTNIEVEVEAELQSIVTKYAASEVPDGSHSNADPVTRT